MGSQFFPTQTFVRDDPSVQRTFPAAFQDRFLPGGHVVTDAHGIIRLADRTAADMMTASSHDLIGCALPDVLAPEDAAVVQSQLRKLEQGASVLEWEITIAPKGLRRFSAWLTVSALRETSGRIAAVHWVIRDGSAWARWAAGDRLLQAMGDHVLDGAPLPRLLSHLCGQVARVFPRSLVRVAIRDTEGRFIFAQADDRHVNADQVCREWTRDERRELESVLETRMTLHRCEALDRDGALSGVERHPARLLVPLCARDRAVGVLSIDGASREAFDAGAIHWCEHLAGRVTHFIAIRQDMTARTETEARIFHLAHHDPLTGLPNRTLLSDRLTQALAQAKRHGRGVGVLFVDLDQFKAVNDSLGHETGDAFLKIAADRLTRCVRATDTVARMSGDEFVVILQDVHRGQDAELVARNILEAVRQPATLTGQSVHVTASVGISMYPFHAADPETLIAQADQAMYRAKEQGGHGCHMRDAP